MYAHACECCVFMVGKGRVREGGKEGGREGGWGRKMVFQAIQQGEAYFEDVGVTAMLLLYHFIIVTQAQVLTGKTWYPGNLSHKEAVSRLMEDSERSDGSYIVYDHPDPDRENSFALLVWWKGLVHKLSINEVRSTDDEGREKIEYALGEDVNQKKHSTVKALIKYHRGVTGVAIQLEDGTRITLKKSIAKPRGDTLNFYIHSASFFPRVPN